MGRTTWIAAVTLLAGLTGSADARAETTDPLTLQVMIHDETGIPLAALHRTQAEASRIFKAAGITLTWVPPGEVPANSLIVKIVETPIGQKSRNPNVLGVSPGSKEAPGRVAWLYYSRIHDLARFLHLEVSQLLGHVMAHEMGHLVLPYGAHAAAGLMKAGWDTQQAYLAATGALTFEPSQAALIRKRLRRASQASADP
jgi:hypothetical protein